MATLGETVRATGRRKESVARVRIVPGSGRFALNGRSLEDYFPRPALQMVVTEPLRRLKPNTPCSPCSPSFTFTTLPGPLPDIGNLPTNKPPRSNGS